MINIYKFNVEKIIQFLFVLLLISYSLGNAAINIVLTILLLFTFPHFFKQAPLKVLFYKLRFVLFFFLYTVCASLFINSNINDVGLFRFFLITMIGYFSFNIISKSKFIFFSTIIFASLVSADILTTYFFDINIFKFSNPELFTGIFENEQVVGSYLSKILSLFIGLYFIFEKKNFSFKNIVYFALIILISFVLVLSNERRAIIDLLVFLILFNIFFYNKKNFIISIIYLIFIFLISISNENIKQEIYKKTKLQLGLLKIENGIKNWDGVNLNIQKNLNDQEKFGILYADNSFTQNQYFAMYYTSYNIWRENIFFGVGNKMFREECKKTKYEYDTKYATIRCNTHPHNIYLQILSEFGLIGIILFILIIFKLLKNNVAVSNENINKIFLLLLIAWLIPLPSGNIFSTWLGTLFWLNVGFLTNDQKSNAY